MKYIRVPLFWYKSLLIAFTVHIKSQDFLSADGLFIFLTAVFEQTEVAFHLNKTRFFLKGIFLYFLQGIGSVGRERERKKSSFTGSLLTWPQLGLSQTEARRQESIRVMGGKRIHILESSSSVPRHTTWVSFFLFIDHLLNLSLQIPFKF